jgi:hypothetical protein
MFFWVRGIKGMRKKWSGGEEYIKRDEKAVEGGFDGGGRKIGTLKLNLNGGVHENLERRHW